LIKYIRPFLAFLALSAFLASCDGLKEGSVAHFYHNMTARFNGYFNAKEKMKEVEANMFKGQQDKYDRIIPVFTVGDEQSAKGYYTDLETIIKKCTTVIKKHGISKWVDDCYLLIGKAYYYKRDYYTALETFDYLNTRYPNGMPAQESKLWVTRALMDMGKMNDALAQITSIRLDKKFPEELKKNFQLIQADYLIRTNQYKEAVDMLEKTLPEVKGKNFKARYMFILAQLYQQMGNQDKAATYYTGVIKKNPAYDMAFQAKLGLSEVSNNTETVRKYLDKLTKDDKNISYFDQIYYTLAKIEMKDGNVPMALADLNKSVRVSKGNPNQKARSYLMAGDIYFNRQDYAIAKSFYDSASTNMTKDFLNYAQFQARQAVLSDLVKNLITIQREDSLQKLSLLPKDQLTQAVDAAIAADKKKAQEAQQQKQNNTQNTFNPNFNTGGGTLSAGDQTANTNPFYNQTAIAQGYQEFQQKWGDRPLEDNWRRKNKATEATTATDNQTDSTKDTLNKTAGTQTNDSSLVNKEILKDVPVSKQKYYTDIPFTAAQRSQSDLKIQDAMMNTGTIYYEKLNEKKKAAGYYEDLLQRFPNFKQSLVVHYDLYRIYSDLKDTANANKHKNYILNNFPGSQYAMLILHPDELRNQYRQKNSDPVLEGLYASAFDAYQNHDCNGIRSKWQEANKSANNYLKSKFAYLSMMCNIREDSTGQQLDSVKAFIVHYPGDEITAQATVLKEVLEQKKLDEQKSKKVTMPLQQATTISAPQLPGSAINAPLPDKIKEKPHTIAPTVTYIEDQNQPHYYVIVFPVSYSADSVKRALSNYNSENYPGVALNINSYLLNDTLQFVTVKNFPDMQRTFNYYRDLPLTGIYDRLKLPYHQEFIISSSNLPLFLKNKDLDGYVAFFKKNYL
jgi:tetratricopeptide (TPR) repeat protein